MRQIEVLANTEYQDLYRITDGVLLAVNKFEDCTQSIQSLYMKKEEVNGMARVHKSVLVFLKRIEKIGVEF